MSHESKETNNNLQADTYVPYACVVFEMHTPALVAHAYSFAWHICKASIF
jgi:hypothetical protein